MIYTTSMQSPVGTLVLAARDDALNGLWIQGQKYFPVSFQEPVTEQAAYPVLRSAAGWIDRYFAGQRPSISELKLSPSGTPFQKAVWNALCDIPYGELTTYGALSHKVAAVLGKPRMSAQAVGGAVGHNAISIVIPCHRVVGAGGSLTGYAGGIDKKIKLLQHEGAYRAGLFPPLSSTAP